VVDANDGRKVWIRPGAFRDEDAYPQAEVRALYSRTEGSIGVVLAILESGDGVTRNGELDERKMREEYEVWRPLRVADKPIALANERLLERDEAAALHFLRLDLLDALPESYDELPERERER
jgi:hypothetical protein